MHHLPLLALHLITVKDHLQGETEYYLSELIQYIMHLKAHTCPHLSTGQSKVALESRERVGSRSASDFDRCLAACQNVLTGRTLCKEMALS